MSKLTIAIPTGRLGKNVLKKFSTANLITEDMSSTRKLDITDPVSNLRFLFVKPSDVVTYVKRGVADIGIVGKDNILEEAENLYELLDLKIGACDVIVAGLDANKLINNESKIKVATKYPTIAKQYFKETKRKIDIIKLNGSIELAPLVGLSDVIVDITETGETLRANGLEIFETICSISARVIANPALYRFKTKEVTNIVQKLEESL